VKRYPAQLSKLLLWLRYSSKQQYRRRLSVRLGLPALQYLGESDDIGHGVDRLSLIYRPT